MNRDNVLQKMKDKSILSYEEMKYMQQEPLNDKEAFRMVEDDPKKVAQYEHYYDLREAVKEQTLTEQQLKGLIDTLFSSNQKQDEFFNANTLYEELKTKLPNDSVPNQYKTRR